MTNKTRQLLGWIGGQLHAAVDAFDPNDTSRPQDVALFTSVILRKLSEDTERMFIKRVADPSEIEIARGMVH